MLLKSESVELCTVNSLLLLLQTRLMFIDKRRVIIFIFIHFSGTHTASDCENNHSLISNPRKPQGLRL